MDQTLTMQEEYLSADWRGLSEVWIDMHYVSSQYYSPPQR